MTDGNLSRHLHALAEFGIIATFKEGGARRPTTVCRITKSGRERFLSYIDQLECVVRDVHRRADESRASAQSRQARLAPT